MPSELPQLKIRLPSELKEFIEFFAKTNGHSMNAEIVRRLALSVRPTEFDKFTSSLDEEEHDLLKSKFENTFGANFDFYERGADYSVEQLNETLEAIHEKLEKQQVLNLVAEQAGIVSRAVSEAIMAMTARLEEIDPEVAEKLSQSFLE